MATTYTTALNQYKGNGVSTTFSVTFPYTKKSDVKVYLKQGLNIQVVLEQDVDYSFIDDETILFPVEGSQYGVLTADDVLAFQRESSFSSEYVFSNQKRLFPEEVMNSDDNLMRLVQENKRDLEKAIKIQPTSAIDSDTFFNEVDRIYQSIDSVDIVAQVADEVKTTADNIDAILDAPNLAQSASESARVSRVWATGSDPEVQELEAGEHSSRSYSNIAMAIANTPEDVPILESTLLATNVIKGEKGDKGDAWIGGDVTGNVTFKGDDNHPLNVEGMAGATPSGVQLTDSLGSGESYFEQYNTGDRYGTKIRNKNNTTGQTVDLDLYQTNAGKSVLDLSKINTILAPQLLDILYPIGSYYLSEEDSCPLGDWMEDCLWEKVGTSIVSGASAAVVGNGMSLGLTNGSVEGYLSSWRPGSAVSGTLALSNDNTLGNSQSNGYASGGTSAFGITTDPEKSGIIANLPTIQVNIFRRVQ